MENRVTISLDFELGWGSIETGMWRAREARGVYCQLRQSFEALCAKLEERQLAVTFAMVGAANQSPGTQAFDHLPDDARKAAENFVAEAAPLTLDGRDLLDRVLAMRTKQDVGVHSYSHTRFNWRGYAAAAKEEDTRRARAALQTSGVDARSFVYPLNITDDHSILDRAGINIARLPPPMALTRLGKLKERVGRAPPSAHHVAFNDALTLEVGSLLYVWGVRRDWRIRRWMSLRQTEQALDRAKRGKGNFHLWLHPFNLVEVPGLFRELMSFLDRAADLQDAGKIAVTPMIDIGGSKRP